MRDYLTALWADLTTLLLRRRPAPVVASVPPVHRRHRPEEVAPPPQLAALLAYNMPGGDDQGAGRHSIDDMPTRRVDPALVMRVQATVPNARNVPRARPVAKPRGDRPDGRV